MIRLVKSIFIFTVIALACAGCDTMSFSDLEKTPPPPKYHKSAVEENLDDDLDPTEQKAVAPIFENDAKERKRAEKSVF